MTELSILVLRHISSSVDLAVVGRIIIVIAVPIQPVFRIIMCLPTLSSSGEVTIDRNTRP